MLAETATTLTTYIANDDWAFQRKVDGDRFLVEVNEGQIVVWGRNGQPKVSNIPFAVLGEFQTTFPLGQWVFDGEIIGRLLVLFDLPLAAQLISTETPFEERYAALELLMIEWKPNPANVVCLPLARTRKEKEALAKEAQDQHWEGVMLRHRTGTYKPGGRSRQLLKYKFVKEVDAIVTAVGVDGHDNVVLSLLDPDYGETGRVVEIGRASAIGKKPKPSVGQVWETAYLYVVDPAFPRLYQPRLVRCRDGEKRLDECLLSQLDGAYTDRQYVDKTRNR